MGVLLNWFDLSSVFRVSSSVSVTSRSSGGHLVRKVRIILAAKCPRGDRWPLNNVGVCKVWSILAILVIVWGPGACPVPVLPGASLPCPPPFSVSFPASRVWSCVPFLVLRRLLSWSRVRASCFVVSCVGPRVPSAFRVPSMSAFRVPPGGVFPPVLFRFCGTGQHAGPVNRVGVNKPRTNGGSR